MNKLLLIAFIGIGIAIFLFLFSNNKTTIATKHPKDKHITNHKEEPLPTMVLNNYDKSNYLNIEHQIEQIETIIDNSKIIDKLNQNNASNEEKRIFFNHTKTLNELRAKILEQELLNIEKEIATLEKDIPAKIQLYKDKNL